jgi:hypothetical protein
MTTQRGILGLVGICVLIVLLSVAGLASVVLTHLDLSLDGLLLTMTCLMMGGLFLLMLGLIAKEQGWLPGGHKKESSEAPAPQAAAARTAPAKSSETVTARSGEGK